MKVGAFEIYPLNNGNIYLDGGAVFGIVPRVLWEKAYPPDEKNRIPLFLHCPLIVTEKYKILIDTGVGTKHNEKFCHLNPANKAKPCCRIRPEMVESPRDVKVF